MSSYSFKWLCNTEGGVAALWIFHAVLQSSDCLLWGKSCSSDNLSVSFGTSFLARQQQQTDVQRATKNYSKQYLFIFLIGPFKSHWQPTSPRSLPFSLSQKCLPSNNFFIKLKPTNDCPRVVYWRKYSSSCHKLAAHDVKTYANLTSFYSTTEEIKL